MIRRPLRTGLNLASTGRGETGPQRFDELGDKRAVSLKFLHRGKMRPRGTELAHDDGPVGGTDRDRSRFRDQAEPDLTAAGQLDIDLGEQLRIEQCPVLDAVAAVDAEPYAQGIKAVLGAGMLRARQHQRIDHAVHADGVAAAPLELEIEEAEIKPGVVRDERGILDEVEQFVDPLEEPRLVRQEQVAEPVHFLRLEGHVALGIEVSVEVTPGLDAVKNLDAADLDHAVAAERIEAGGFSVEDDFPHG